MKRLTLLVAGSFLLGCIGVARAVQPEEKGAKAKASKSESAKAAKKAPAKGSTSTVKQSVASDTLGDGEVPKKK